MHSGEECPSFRTTLLRICLIELQSSFYGYHKSVGNCIDPIHGSEIERGRNRMVGKAKNEIKHQPQLPELEARKQQDENDEMKDARRDPGRWPCQRTI